MHADRMDSVAMSVTHFANLLEIGPQGITVRAMDDRRGDKLDEGECEVLKAGRQDKRPESFQPQRR
ncbi:hypothetical protein [Microvirga zambiensis]|uniref:hypothetical protein n=1 Tax=Microvirga zambiensis TaxID=1402137 RepID=UPI00191FC9FC|nr:hypothetical protein [Microvirga zambiensis]